MLPQSLSNLGGYLFIHSFNILYCFSPFWQRLLNVIAIEFTQIFVLRRKAFIELVPPENALYQRLEEKAKERMQQILLEEELYKSHLLMVDGNAGGGAMTD